MENLLKESKQLMNKYFFQKIARSFNHSSGRAGKPVIKWTEVENWFQKRQNDCPSKVDSSIDASKDVCFERERQQKLAEEEEVRRMRKQLIPKAQPMPYFDRPFIPRM